MKTTLIKKHQQGGTSSLKVPNYFINYGINADKLYGMYQALRSKGLSQYPALMYAWQAIKEQPKKYYAFGKSYDNVNDWAQHSYDALTGKRVNGLYKNAQYATNYDEWRKSMKSFNTHPEYWDTWLTTGMGDGLNYLKTREQQSASVSVIQNKYGGLLQKIKQYSNNQTN